jgi:hypothetical protein
MDVDKAVPQHSPFFRASPLPRPMEGSWARDHPDHYVDIYGESGAQCQDSVGQNHSQGYQNHSTTCSNYC